MPPMRLHLDTTLRRKHCANQKERDEVSTMGTTTKKASKTKATVTTGTARKNGKAIAVVAQPVPPATPVAIVLSLDVVAKRPWLEESLAEIPDAQRAKKMTEAEMVKRAAVAAGFGDDLTSFARYALHSLSRRELTTVVREKTGQGVAGSSDVELAAAYKTLHKKMLEKGKTEAWITPARLKYASGVNFRSSKRWLERRSLGVFSPAAAAAAAATPATPEPSEPTTPRATASRKKKGQP